MISGWKILNLWLLIIIARFANFISCVLRDCYCQLLLLLNEMKGRGSDGFDRYMGIVRTCGENVKIPWSNFPQRSKQPFLLSLLPHQTLTYYLHIELKNDNFFCMNCETQQNTWHNKTVADTIRKLYKR